MSDFTETVCSMRTTKSHPRQPKILDRFPVDGMNIYCSPILANDQKEEINSRKKVAEAQSSCSESYLDRISAHHSIPVMDKEVDLFLKDMPENAKIIDAGGCLGWHWRRINSQRPDVKIFIVDLVQENLVRATSLLDNLINKQVFLVHGDITDLLFENNVFDGYWSVQTLQHVPNFEAAIQEAYRILKPKGRFSSYSLNHQSLMQLLCWMFRKKYIKEGKMPGEEYLLKRASKNQRHLISEIFGNKVSTKFTEILFKPEFGLSVFGKKESLIGKFDSLLSSPGVFLSWLARQQSFHSKK